MSDNTKIVNKQKNINKDEISSLQFRLGNYQDKLVKVVFL